MDDGFAFFSVLAIARRDYLAAVRTKAFILSLLLVPVLGFFGIGVQAAVIKADRQTTKAYAVVDRTLQLKEAIERANERRTNVEIISPTTKLRTAPIFALEFVPPSADEPEAILRQRFELSRRHQRGEIEGFLEIGADVFMVKAPGSPADDRRDVRYQSDKAAEREFASWAGRIINNAVQEKRFAEHAISSDLVRRIQTPVAQQYKGTTKADPVTGAFAEASEENRIVAFALPAVLVALMLMMVLLGSMPAMQGIVEEKQQRIAEVLLGCVSPFELMLGKLLGIVAVSLTVSAVYLTGGFAIAARFGAANLLSPWLIGWFVLFTILATLVFGSLFMAVGAAAGDMKETQSLQMPIMSIAMLPLLLLGTILHEPNGKVALVGSFIPFSAPMLMTARLSSSSAVPTWQPALAAVGVLLTALVCVWAAGRIFRVGLLLQGKGVRLADLLRWVVRG